MIDPYAFYLSGRRPSARPATESKPNSTVSKQSDAEASATASISKNSSVDSKSHQSSYNGGDSLSPASTISTDQATKPSLAASPSSPNSAASLPHKLPEFEHFRQNSPLMPEFYPRTSEFFSQGRRRSSIAVSPDTAAASAGLAAAVAAVPAIPEDSASSSRGSGAGSNPAQKPVSFRLPLNFDEHESLVGEQLPVRLGLAPPSHSHDSSASGITYKTRVGHGYYFYIPPPVSRAPSACIPSSSASLRRRNTDTPEQSSLSLNTKILSSTSIASSPASISPTTGASSTQRARAQTSVSSSPASTPAGNAARSRDSAFPSRGRLPPASPDCWDPQAYFTKTRSRVKGKMREFVYHAFPSSVVPYWYGYNNEAMEAETTIHLDINAVLHGNTLRALPEGSRPRRVLDLGCGKGSWCLDMAREWKSTEFVGLDIVPIQPPMHHLADPDLEHRVSWVIANFLETLPFPDASFDYVHVRLIMQGVPEDRWVDVFSEVRRVLAPGGVLESIEGNYSFFGHASLVDANELKDLEQGRTAARKGAAVRLPKRLKVLGDASASTDVDALEVVLERMMHRRFINPTPLSVMPSALLLPGFSKVATGNPRHLPVYAESSAQRARARAATMSSGDEAGTSSANNTSSEDESKRHNKFTSRTQIGNPLLSQFAITDPDLFRTFVIFQQLDHFSSSRELIWAEAEAEKRSLHGAAQPELPKMDSTRRFGQGNPAALKPFAHPWKSKEDFFRAMDKWIDATKALADTELLLRNHLGWEHSHDDLTVEGRKHAERRRKMSISSVAISSLGFDQLSLDESADKELTARRDSPQAAVSPTNASSFAAAATQAHEAPARLQTTRSSAPDTRVALHVDAHEGDADSKTVDQGKSKKKSKRPSSSGGVGSSTGSIGTGRARTFGRGGAAGGTVAASMQAPLPDAPAFMSGYAFGSATRTNVAPSLRGGSGSIVSPGGRKASVSARSLGDRASLSGKTERDDAKDHSADSATSRTTAPRDLRPLTVTEQPSPAAAYAATQRKSHGLEDEYRLQSDPSSQTRRMSRPVSPTSAIPSPTTSGTDVALGSRPPIGGRQGGADSRSVSMPVTTATAAAGGGGGSVRIAEPPIRPSKGRSRSKSNAKEVALIGFYDTTGYIAIA